MNIYQNLPKGNFNPRRKSKLKQKLSPRPHPLIFTTFSFQNISLRSIFPLFCKEPPKASNGTAAGIYIENNAYLLDFKFQYFF